MQLVPRTVARERAHARRFPRPLWLLIGANAVSSLGAGLFVPYWALYLTTSLGASGVQAGALLALAGGMGLVGAPFGGLLADRIGRRPMLLFATTGAALGLILYGSLESLLAIAIMTPFWAIMSDLGAPAISAAIADVVEPDLRTEAYGLRRQAGNIAFALGPPLGAVLALGLSLRWLIGLFQYPVARWAGGRSPRAMLIVGTALQGAALFVLWPASPVLLLIGAIVLLTLGEMLLSPVASALAAALAPPRLRGSYEGVVDTAFAVSWAPGVLVGLWLVGDGRGEVMLAVALPLAALAALCFLPLPRRPVPIEDVLPAPAGAAAVP